MLLSHRRRPIRQTAENPRRVLGVPRWNTKESLEGSERATSGLLDRPSGSRSPVLCDGVIARPDPADVCGLRRHRARCGVLISKAYQWLSCRVFRLVTLESSAARYHELVSVATVHNDASITTIYVYLLDEGVDVWRPVQARHIGTDRYQIVSVNIASGDELWQFNTGDTVRCKSRMLSDGEVLVAYERVG